MSAQPNPWGLIYACIVLVVALGISVVGNVCQQLIIGTQADMISQTQAAVAELSRQIDATAATAARSEKP